MNEQINKFIFKGNLSDDELRRYGLVKCKRCGFVGFHDDFPLEPRIRKKDWIISLIFLPVGGMGIVNLVGTYLQRSTKVRNRQCPLCDKVFDLNAKK